MLRMSALLKMLVLISASALLTGCPELPFYQLNITVSGSGQVTTSPSPLFGYYPPFITVTLSATPDPGYQFMAWSGPDAASLDPPYGANTALYIDGNKSVQASFIPIPPTSETGDSIATYYVAPPPLGLDAPGRGTLSAPYATIAYAINRTVVPAGAKVRIQAASGIYPGNLTLKPRIIVSGAPEGEVWIEGTVTGASNSALERVRLAAPEKNTYLLDMNNVAMRLSGVWFIGGPERSETGILVDGTAPVASVIDGCYFSFLSIGIDIGGAIPTIRRCVFENLADSAIVVRQDTGKYFEAKAIGDETDPNTGWNTFRSSIDGPAVVNERNESIQMQLNDWDTNDAGEIADRIEGQAAYVPYLAQGAGLLAASIFCTVVDGKTQAPVLDASVRLVPSGYNPVTNNDNGIYAYPAIPEGSYTLQVSAPDHQTVSRAVNVAGGGLASVTVPLGAETPGRSCGCDNDGKGLPNAGDLFIGALSVLVLLLFKNAVPHAKH